MTTSNVSDRQVDKMAAEISHLKAELEFSLRAFLNNSKDIHESIYEVRKHIQASPNAFGNRIKLAAVNVLSAQLRITAMAQALEKLKTGARRQRRESILQS